MTDARVVLDANVVIGWCFGRNLPGWSRTLLAEVREHGAQAPEMLWFEAGRVIMRRASGKTLSQDRADWFLEFWSGLDIAYDRLGVETQYAAARALAVETGLTVKDAAYLELAERNAAPLATRDRELRDVARARGVVLAV